MSFLFGKKVNTVTAAEKISQFQSTTCDFGTPLPYVFGTAKRGPNLINYQDFYAQPIVTKQKTGKRSSSTSIDYKYFAYIELALCEGIIDGIGKLWVGDKEYDSLSAFNATVNAQGAPLSLNAGDISAPTTYMSTNHPDIAVGYNQMAYLYGYVYLGMNNASIPSYAVEVQGLLRGAGNNGDGTDANPAAVINYMLNLMGYGSHVDSTSYAEYLQYCTQADLLISTPQDAFTSQKKIQEVVKELLTLTNTYMFWSVDKFKFVPRDTMARGTWSPRTQNGPDLTPDEMMKQSNGACVMYERKDTSEVYNRFGVTFTSRANQYEAETVFYEDTTDVATNGIKSAPDVDGSWLHTVERAVTVAEMQARINRTENIKYTFRLPWSYAYLEPGDIVTLTDPEIGLDHQLVMIDSVTEQDDETLILTALRREIATAATYNTGSDDYNIIDNNGDPGDVLAPIIFTPPPQLATSANIEVWVAVQGQTESWGGCQIYASTKDGDYELIGIHNKNSNYGKLLTAISASDTTVEVEFYNWWPVEIPEGSAQDAANGVTDIWIDGECCAYTASTLIGANQYRLTLLRGKYGSTAAAHAIDDEFALMDGNLFSMVLPSGYANKTLYAKFPSFNTIGSKTQDLADIGYYTFTTSAEGYTENYVEQELTGYASTSDLDDYVAKTSPDYIKSASVTGNTLTLTKGNDTAVTFTPSGGGGGGSYTAGDGIDITNDTISLEVASANDIGGIKVGSGLSIDANGVLSAIGGGSYTETVLFSNSSGITSGSIPLNDNLSDYEFIQFTLVRTGSSAPKEIVTNIATSDAVKNASRFCIHAYDNDFFDVIYASETSLTINAQRNIALTEVLGIKIGGGGLSPSDITTGSTNGTISVDGTDVAVAGLGSAAYTASGDYVTLADAQTITGRKTFKSSPYYRVSTLVKGNNPSSTTYPLWSSFFDGSTGTAEKDRFGAIGCEVNTYGKVRTVLSAYKNVADSTDSAQLAVHYPTSGNPYATAPTPDSTVTGNEITTASWVNSKLPTITSGTADGTIAVNGTDVSVTGLGSNAFNSTAYVPLNGGSTVEGGSISYQNNSITKGTNPTSEAYPFWSNVFDKNGTATANRLGAFHCIVTSGGSVRTGVASYKYVSGSTTSAAARVQYPLSGDPSFVPSASNTLTIGTAALLWKELFCASATINTSDERLKDNIEFISDDVLDAWAEVNFQQFQFKDSLAQKGESARIHTGLIAQRIKSVFEKHGLDAFRYGLLCYDEWDAEDAETDEDGNVVNEGREAGNLYSLRYEEALCMESAYQRRRTDRLEERIARLEMMLNAKG